MHPAATGWPAWLESTAPAVAMRQWLWLYPVVEVVHIVGFVVLVGSAFMFDLRLLGFSPTLPVSRMARHLLPWARASLLLVVPTGALMFVAHAGEFASNPAFQVKLALIAAAFLNAGVFHRFPFRSVDGWDVAAAAPTAARAAAVLSLLLWIGVLACGRLLAYF